MRRPRQTDRRPAWPDDMYDYRYAQVRRRLKVVLRQFVIQHGRKPCLDDLRSGSTMFPDRETRARVKRLTNEYNRLRKQYATSAKGDL